MRRKEARNKHAPTNIGLTDVMEFNLIKSSYNICAPKGKRSLTGYAIVGFRRLLGTLGS